MDFCNSLGMKEKRISMFLAPFFRLKNDCFLAGHDHRISLQKQVIFGGGRTFWGANKRVNRFFMLHFS